MEKGLYFLIMMLRHLTIYGGKNEIEKYWLHWLTGKCSLKITRRYYSILIRMAEMQTSELPSAGGEWSNRCFPTLFVGAWIGSITLENRLEWSIKGKQMHTLWPKHSIPLQECVHILKHPATVEEMGFFASVMYFYNGKLSLFSHSVVSESLSCVRLFATPWTAACHPSLSPYIAMRMNKH